MSEDVKPKLYYVYKGIAYEINNGRSLLEDVCAPIERFNMKTIELDPTMRLMDDMAEAISNWKKQVDTYGGDYLPGNYKQLSNSLEKYKKFKEALK